MASLVGQSGIKALLIPRGVSTKRSTAAAAASSSAGGETGQSQLLPARGILACKRSLHVDERQKLLLPMRRRFHGCIDHLCTPSTSGVFRRSQRTCAATGAGAGQREDSPNPQAETSYLPNSPDNFDVKQSIFFKRPPSNKGWDDYRLLAELRTLAVIADDRSEMHRAVATQRDNWGKLLQVTITMSMISAGILSALNTRATQSFSLSLTAVLLSAGSIIFMSFENWFQPSQLAEEQRAATRFFRNMVTEIEENLKPGSGSHLKEEAHLYYQAKLERLQYLDKAFPLPLFPGGIDKFPTNVGPSVLSAEVNLNEPEVTLFPGAADNGWTQDIVDDLKKTSDLLRKSDVATYVGWEKNALKINKALAITGPVLALVSIVANLLPGTGIWGALVASACCVLAALCSSFSHDAQVGMVYEMYREVAGSFEDIEKEIQRNLRLPVEQRQDGKLFHQKVALQLGRIEGKLIVRDDSQQSAGKLL